MVTEEKNATGSEVGFLDVRNLKKHFPIQKGFLKRTVGAVRACLLYTSDAADDS